MSPTVFSELAIALMMPISDSITFKEKEAERDTPWKLLFEQTEAKNFGGRVSSIDAVQIKITLYGGTFSRLSGMQESIYSNFFMPLFTASNFKSKTSERHQLDYWRFEGVSYDVKHGGLKKNCKNLSKSFSEWIFYIPTDVDFDTKKDWMLPFYATDPNEMLRLFLHAPMQDKLAVLLHGVKYNIEVEDTLSNDKKRALRFVLNHA